MKNDRLKMMRATLQMLPPDEFQAELDRHKATSDEEFEAQRVSFKAATGVEPPSLDVLKALRDEGNAGMLSPIGFEAAVSEIFEGGDFVPVVFSKMPPELRELVKGDFDLIGKNVRHMLKEKARPTNETSPEYRALIDLCLETMAAAWRASAMMGVTKVHLKVAKSYERSALGKKGAEKRQSTRDKWQTYVRHRMGELGSAKKPRQSAESLATKILSKWECKELRPVQRTLVDFIRKELALERISAAASHTVYD